MSEPRSRLHWLLKLPIIRDVFLILNTYAWSGAVHGLTEIAPLAHWRKKYVVRAMCATVLASICSYVNYDLKEKAVWPSDIVFSIAPSLIGFGIGVYAVLFALPWTLGQGGGEKANLINTDMAMPIIAMAFALLVSTLVKALGNPPLGVWMNWFLLYFFLFALLELIALIFLTASKEAYKEQAKEREQPPPSEG